MEDNKRNNYQSLLDSWNSLLGSRKQEEIPLPNPNDYASEQEPSSDPNYMGEVLNNINGQLGVDTTQLPNPNLSNGGFDQEAPLLPNPNDFDGGGQVDPEQEALQAMAQAPQMNVDREPTSADMESVPQQQLPKEKSISNYDRLMKEYQDYLSQSQQKMNEARQAKSKNDLFTGIMNSVSQLSSGLASRGGNRVEAQKFDALTDPTVAAKEDLALQGKKFDKMGEFKKLAREEDMYDPNSEKSKSVKQMLATNYPKLKEQYGAEWDNMSAASFDDVFKVLQLKEQQDARVQAAQALAGQRAEEKKTAADIKAEEKMKLSDKQNADVTSFDAAIGAIDNIIAQKPGWDTGKLSMGMNTVAGWVGMDDAQKSAFKSDVGESLAQYIKGISGATVSPTERIALLQNVPSVYDNDETFMAKATALKKRLVDRKKIELDNLAKQGKKVDDYRTNPEPKEPAGKKQSEPKLSAKDKAALEWADKNPDDPRAQKIKQLHGM